MSDEKQPIIKNGIKGDFAGQEKSREKITIQRGPGYVPGLLESDQETHRKKPIYIDAKKRRLPPWAIAMITLVALMLGLFLFVPSVVDKGRPQPPAVMPTVTDSTEPSNHFLSVVKVSSAPLFDSTSFRAVRISELLLNEPVTILDASDRSMLEVLASDGTVGFVSRDHLSADVRSLSATGAVMKVIVRSQFKRVMTHARSGSLLVEAPMGTILYADYQSGDLLRVRLPEGQIGWVNSSGLLLLDPLDTITVDHFHEQFSSALMAFYNRPLVPGGVTARGISPEGAIFVASRLNGKELPRTLDAQALVGETVELTVDAEGKKELNELLVGDLLFFHRVSNPAKLESVAIRVDDGQLLVAFPNRQTLQLIDIESKQAQELAERVTSVRRLQPPNPTEASE
ncbi:MAG TPA: C40 family peptidase [Clostridiaceae bacterium]|nr:C40 family peptidase [Clostridiaceae bacterium]